ncbi:hypothetical protein GTH52_10600 [Clostridium tyrobutyricum]|uniref:Uncharacterized protein n=1 Tax=Clostridium tyrobutyricum DIVETGP TaxID=1408889 RepID=W6N5L2_CLOTY|nr:hypothetical protein [Clostridium tyrobutyricum]AND83546.1 hypothetical protein CTK_C02760 [Clostridium tyrobutyricum]ANP68333.1 hypothetical protein BA182_01185 [Clostridium tyrobutyricum]MBV4433149.1 hypothetical protein [Clostridium tyrobutyricum]QNB67322.1 hypothetical protein GTH52_10600 [Clostridium tyrobutyricum]CDL91360.1 hypothetical protein CTDIVETGP_1430 [Clostridium tyrobutyricum DIVETGP]
MDNSDFNCSNFLDNIRSDKGIEDLKNFFTELCNKDVKTALKFINDEKLNFSTLFILRDEIKKFSLVNKLTIKNKTALLIIKEILSDNKHNLEQEHLSFDYIQIIHSTLNWILKSGYKSDGLNDEYDRVLDITCGILTKLYKDKALLPIMADLIFERYKKGTLIHDLVWAFFQAADPQSLLIIGEKLLSTAAEDVKMACRLLNFIPAVNNGISKEKKYTNFLNWMKENSPFLKYTGESFQQTTNPTPYKIVLEGKYLCKRICCDTGKALRSPSEKENSLLNDFKKLDHDTKVLLSNFSLRIHHKNIYLWNIWHRYSLNEQIKIARIGGVQ